MNLLKFVIGCVFLIIFGPTVALAGAILPFTGDKCRQGSPKEIKSYLSSLKVRVFAFGQTESRRVFFMVSKSHEYLYMFDVAQKDDATSLCLVGGGREADLVAADYLEDVKSKWGGRINRYHLELAKRALGKSIPSIVKNIPADDAIIAMTWYFVQPQWENTYDEEKTYKIGGKDIAMTRGEMVAVSNKKVSEMDIGKTPLNRRNRRDFLALLKDTDHGFNPMILIGDKSDDDWAVVVVDRKKKTVKVVLEGNGLTFGK